MYFIFCKLNLGKTCLCDIICRKAGIELIVEPLSSSELNRGIVGATEQLLMALFQRAEYLPHLLCCIVRINLIFLVRKIKWNQSRCPEYLGHRYYFVYIYNL